MAVLNYQKRLLAPIYRLEMENFITSFEETVFDRVLASFNSVEGEATQKMDECVEYLGQQYHDDSYMDMGDVYDIAEGVGASHYLMAYRLREHTIRSYTMYLFHFFEKEVQKILLYSYVGIDRKYTEKFISEHLNRGVLNFLESQIPKLANNSDWLFIKNDLQLLANAIKHGYGRAFNSLKDNPQYYGKYFKNESFASPDNICITDDQLQEFIHRLRAVCEIILSYYVQEY